MKFVTLDSVAANPEPGSTYFSPRISLNKKSEDFFILIYSEKIEVFIETLIYYIANIFRYSIIDVNLTKLNNPIYLEIIFSKRKYDNVLIMYINYYDSLRYQQNIPNFLSNLFRYVSTSG